MSEPAITTLTTKLPFETVKKLLRVHCREPFTIMLPVPEDEAEEVDLTLNIMFADHADLTRFRAAVAAH